jgi:tetratricopeptide (TPR) repeat protein
MGVKKQAKKEVPQAEQVVVVATKRRFTKRKLVLLASVTLVLAAAIIAWLLIAGPGSDEGPKTAKDQNASVLKDSAALERDRNYSGQAKELQTYIDSKPPQEFAEKEIIRLAVAYQNSGDFQKAIDTYQIALDKYPGSKYAATRGMGFVYMKRGDKTQNKDDYRKAMTYFQQSEKMALADPEKAHVAGSDQNNIRYLKEMLGE